jgi:tRNA (guanine37-N1)-methyltransferase
MRIDVVSIFPDYLEPLNLSLVGKAIQAGVVDLAVHDLRDWTHDRHRRVDDTPYGGGAGMVMKPEPWGEALDSLLDADPSGRLIVLTPSGRLLSQQLADELKDEPRLILACGRYEGIDARVVDHARTRVRVDEVSIGDYVLNGGEAAALVVIEAVVRLIPGVLGNPESLTEESHADGQGGLLEYPVYTKPPRWRDLDVPEVLFSGHHAKIAAWRLAQAVALTGQRRPDLLPADAHRLVISIAAPTDAGELLTLQRASYLTEARLNGSLDIPPLEESLPDVLASLTQGCVLVARRAGRLLGSVRGESGSDDGWTVERLMVAPDVQRTGIGGRLMDEIESRAPAGCRRLRLITGAASLPNLRFYRRRGYAEVGRSRAHGSVEVVILEKELDL